MRAADAIRMMVRESGAWSQNRLGMALGYTPQGLKSALDRRDMRCGLVSRALALLGYELVAVPMGAKLPQGSVRIDGGEAE